MAKTMLVALVAGATLVLAGPVFADKLSATLSGKSEVPPNGSAATGTAELNYDPATRELHWEVTYEGLSGSPVAVHLQGPAAPTKTGTVVVKFESILPSPVTGYTKLTDAQAVDLLAGRYYLNIRTAKHPSGEIRGQITKR